MDASIDLQREIQRLSAAVQALAETQATHTELLKLMVEAATGEGGTDPVLDRVEQVVASLDRHSEILRRIEAVLTRRAGG